MNSIIYRELKKDDYETVKFLINEAFDFGNIISNIDVLNKCLNVYLRSCLSATTFSSVAVKDGKVIGLILGSSKNKNTLLNLFKHNIALILNVISLLFKPKKDKKYLKDYKKILKSYDELMENRKDDFQGCIELFIVSKECRGLGVGKKLVSTLMNYMKDNSVSNLYLYSDNICNYGFYDSQGFNQLDSRNVEMTNSNKPIVLNVYLYSYDLTLQS